MQIKDVYVPVLLESNVTPEEMLKAVMHQQKNGYLVPATFGKDIRTVAIPKMKIPQEVCEEIILYANHMKNMDFFNRPRKSEKQPLEIDHSLTSIISYRYADEEHVC